MLRTRAQPVIPSRATLSLNDLLDSALCILFPLVLDDLPAPAVQKLASVVRLTCGSRLVVLSAGEESVSFGHLVAVLPVCADGPGHGDNAAEHKAHDSCVGLPVVGLGVPTTGRRPDMLGVPVATSEVAGRQALEVQSHGILPPPPIVKCGCWGC